MRRVAQLKRNRTGGKETATTGESIIRMKPGAELENKSI
jgi:hypothetical protein